MYHTHTEPAKLNFSKLEDRVLRINDPYLGKYNDIKNMINKISLDGGPTLIMATGGSKVIAYYLQLIVERLNSNGVICEVIEPRDYFYKPNINMYSNLVVISASGKTNGISETLSDFKGNKYLITEKEKDADYQVISWGNELFDGEKSFISLATSLGPISLLLDSAVTNDLDPKEIQNINEKIKKIFSLSINKINRLNTSFKPSSLIQIMSGYDTRTSASVLESNLTETGLAHPVIHDKASYCHGRSNLLFLNPSSKMIYLTHGIKDLDRVLIDSINSEYDNVSIFDTSDLEENIFWKEYYLLLQMYYLSKKIASDKQIDLTQPEYNPTLVKRLYKFKGDM